jgi:phosphoribosylaminoimidazole-succinocarboxamide synthase
LPAPLFTPATKAAQGEHDENITFADMQSRVGSDLAAQMRQRSLDVFAVGCRRAQEAGIIVADTKFEFGLIDGQLMLIDEVMTPDSSRFWPMDGYRAGGPQPSFDKQFVRDWLSATPWDKNSPPPELPPDVVAQTRAKYIEACERITGEPFAWT